MTAAKRHDDEFEVDEELVHRLLRAQFPQWADLPLALVEPSGTDHTIYRLGDELVVRMPVMEYATRQAVKEATWVPFLAPQVPLELPTPVAMGEPGEGYPWQWSIVRWIEGERATADNLDLPRAAVDLAAFVRALHACDATDGPRAGRSTGGRGLSLRVWYDALDEWIAKLDGHYDATDAVAAWKEAQAAPDWDGPPVWFHGDLAWNLIARDGRLVGAIDSGYGVGDPACDLMPGWTIFHGEARAVFFAETGLDEATITRSRGWAIAPAIIGLSYYRDVPHLYANALLSIEGALGP
ncbi:MAG TPA: aminoglycoside phosphotransferase family protein [Acidimicrobiales bacterium]|nr:aminoglycoside phosphotransferase family protein [Acidimicrobiales bacterium]